jgi:hypothetical protein
VNGHPIRVSVAGTPRTLELREPTIGRTHVFVADASLHRCAATRLEVARSELYDCVATIDGEPRTWVATCALADDPVTRVGVLLARTALVSRRMRGGIVTALCPRCLDGMWQGSLWDLAEVTGQALREIGDADGELLPFGLSYLPAAPLVPAGPRRTTARIGFWLPSSVGPDEAAASGAGGLRRIDPDAEQEAWRRWAPLGVDPPEERNGWTFESAGFRAVLRVLCALDFLGDKLDARLTPTDVEGLPLSDFCFLDELYRLVFLGTPAVVDAVSCPGCGHRFTPTMS